MSSPLLSPDTPMHYFNSPTLESTEDPTSSFMTSLPTAEKAMVLHAELALCRGRLVEEAQGRFVAEERNARLELELVQSRLHHDHWVACYDVRGLTGNMDYLVRELGDLRDRLSIKQTNSVGTDPPHHPVARSAVPLDRLPDADPAASAASHLSSASGTSPPRNKFSPQRYREPSTRDEAKEVMASIQAYMHSHRYDFF